MTPKVEKLLPRIIPAYAGSTYHLPLRRSVRGDHPRIRGEHGFRRLGGNVLPGSSPHTRGAPTRQVKSAYDDRIIPAYAGSTPSRSSPTWQTSDHPRIRGEHDAHIGSDATYPGSSPHTRGARAPVDMGLSSSRIIPAYAGSTNQPVVISAHHSDHPRIRGEHAHWRHHAMRGAGIIPAYAGSTRQNDARTTETQDHPRIRGEHNAHRPTHERGPGSSPHTRGAQARQERRRLRRRIIPAYAGSTIFQQ